VYKIRYTILKLKMSSSESDDEDWVMYREREEWKDVTPLKQDDGPYPVVDIAYSDKSDEHSERALQLVTDAITLNAANYTVWHFRRILLKSLNKDLRLELEYVTDIIRSQPKNYQVWYHRGIIVQWLNDASAELAFTQEILKDDAKNYHCWQHRQLVLNHFKLWENEADYTSYLIEEDIRNNSAWNQRYYAVLNTVGFEKEVVEKEVGFITEVIKKAPNNESAWNYLRGVLTAAGGLMKFPVLKDDFEKELSGGCDSPFLISFLVDFYEEILENDEKNHEYYKRVIELCNLLADDVDFIRQEYWNYVKRSIENRFRSS